MRICHSLVAALVAAVVALGVSAPSALAKPCGSIKAKGADYTVGGHGVKCRYMRNWSLRMAKEGRKPGGWDCNIRSDGGGCERGSGRKRDFFIYYPVD